MKQITSADRLAVAVAWVAAAGAALMALAHTGVEVPLLSALGPRGGAVPPAVAAFGIGTALFTTIAVGVARGWAWARWVGVAVSMLAVLGGVGQFRGPVSAIGIVVALVLGGSLLVGRSGSSDASGRTGAQGVGGGPYTEGS